MAVLVFFNNPRGWEMTASVPLPRCATIALCNGQSLAKLRFF